MKKFLIGAVASIALSAATAPALAQAGASGGPGSGDVVQIWGQLEESLAGELAEYGSRVDIVTEEQIENGGFTDSTQVLQMQVPGLYLAPKNGPSTMSRPRSSAAAAPTSSGWSTASGSPTASTPPPARSTPFPPARSRRSKC